MSESYHDVHLPARQAVGRVLAVHLAPWVPPQAHVLEIGAGHCHWINAVRAARRVAVDAWPDVSRDLRTFPTQHVDVVPASNVLEHFDPDTASSVIGDIHAVLKPGGQRLKRAGSPR